MRKNNCEILQFMLYFYHKNKHLCSSPTQLPRDIKCPLLSNVTFLITFIRLFSQEAILNDQIGGFYENESSYCSVLVYDTVLYARWLTMFRSHILPSSLACSSEILVNNSKTKQHQNSKDHNMIISLTIFLRQIHDSHYSPLLSPLLTVPMGICTQFPGQSS